MAKKLFPISDAYKKATEENVAYREFLCDHLKHDDVQEHILDALKKRTGFKWIMVRTLLGSVRFWGWMIGLNLGISTAVFKFPELANWIFSFIPKS